jgi:GntR family transcriptional regulator, arabinose operon transcriptional repressor
VIRCVQGKGNYFVGRRSDGEQLAVFSLILPEISHSLYPPLAKGFDDQAGLRQRQVLLCNTDFDVHKQGNLVLQMIEKHVAGVALVPALSAPTPAFHVRQLQLHNIPVVLCHRPVAEVSAPLVTWDVAKVARVAGRTLAGLGHRRIAYFARTRYSVTELHERSLRQTLEESGLELPGNHVSYGESPMTLDDHLDLRIEALKPLVKGLNPVTAIFCNDDNEAEVVYYSLGRLGVRIPDDVSLMGFGDSRFRSGAFFSRLSSVVIDEYKLGSRAAELLHEMQIGQRPIDSDEVIYKPISLWEGRTIAAV